ncbi:F-box domain-containing protein [Zalerion maritima]|uniref:F-box domain-containing protein n=1 Tax=Zalerion maritima TaxID=339359 RepID=A0AAD5RKV1_9PEZI|nr:F-box domain-containing protein [Zalerion maritima]
MDLFAALQPAARLQVLIASRLLLWTASQVPGTFDSPAHSFNSVKLFIRLLASQRRLEAQIQKVVVSGDSLPSFFQIFVSCLYITHPPTWLLKICVTSGHSPTSHVPTFTQGPTGRMHASGNIGQALTPSKLIGDILLLLPTHSLLPLASVSRRFHSAVHSLLRLRLLRAAALSHRELILECYHPTAKLSTPYLACTPTGNAWEELKEAKDLNALATHYTRFRPTLKDGDRRLRRGHPHRSSNFEQLADAKEEKPAVVDITLDSCELFTQLCTVTNVVTLGPRKGFFAGHINVGDGLLRVWREWLAARTGKGPSMGDEDILWADGRRDVGVRFRVLQKHESTMQQPVLLGRDEDPVVSYTLVYEELLVRTSRLLLSVEGAEDEDVQNSACGCRGEAIFYGRGGCFHENVPEVDPRLDDKGTMKVGLIALVFSSREAPAGKVNHS